MGACVMVRFGAVRCVTRLQNPLHCWRRPPGLPSRLQPLNQRHQRSVDLFIDTLETIFQPIECRPPLPLRFTGLDKRVEPVVLGMAPFALGAAL